MEREGSKAERKVERKDGRKKRNAIERQAGRVAGWMGGESEKTRLVIEDMRVNI